ncbi:MAG: HAD family hydrolase [Candidatus Hodarchaeales archaeon]
MPKPTWDLFFDLHGVLADVNKVQENYRHYLVSILTPLGISEKKAVIIHDIELKKWLNAINRISKEFDDGNLDTDTFMEEYHRIDKRWERNVINYLPIVKQAEAAPHLITSVLEYKALANGIYPIFYPEVKNVLMKLQSFKNLSIHVASSASANHVKGAIQFHNLERYFKMNIGYNTVKAPKKAKRGDYFRNLLKLTEVDPTQSIFVGDSIDEAYLAKKFGMNFIMVNRNYRSMDDTEFNENWIIVKDLTEILDHIETFLS